MKKKKGLLASILVLICLIVLYLVMRNINLEEEIQEKAETKTVFEAKEEEIEGLMITGKSGNYEFSRQDDTWIYTEDENFPLDTSVLENKVNTIVSVKSNRTIKPADGLADFGLENPELEVTIKESEGKETVLSFGEVNDAVSGCYMTLNHNSEEIYLVDSSIKTNFQFDLNDMAQKEELPNITSTTIKKVTAEDDTGVKNLKENEDSETGWMLVNNDGTEIAADSGLVSQFMSSFSTMSWNQYVTYDLSNLSSYGLENPKKITIDYQTEETEASSDKDSEQEEETKKIDKQLTILIGEKSEEGDYYAKRQEDKCVYTLSSTIVDKVFNMKADDFLSKKVSDYSFADMDTVTFVKDGDTYKTTKKEVKEKTEDGEDTTETKYMINDKEVDMSAFSEFYTKITDLEWQSMDSNAVPKGEAEMSITFEKGNSIHITTDYYAYDSNFYLVIDSKGNHMLVNKMKVKDMMEGFETLLKQWEEGKVS